LSGVRSPSLSESCRLLGPDNAGNAQFQVHNTIQHSSWTERLAGWKEADQATTFLHLGGAKADRAKPETPEITSL
jgi:hypothetical protein